MIARICKKKALQELHQNVKPDYFFDGGTIGDFSFYYSYSHFSLCFYYFNNNLYTNYFNVPASSLGDDGLADC